MWCLLAQPIHTDGIRVLEAAGLRVRLASEPTMAAVAAEVPGAVAAVTRNAGFDRTAMAAGEALRVLGNHGAGYDPVDVGYARTIGLPIAYAPEANAQSVAEHAMAQMLAVAKRTCAADAAVREGRFSFRETSGTLELAGKTLLVVGFGTIGRRVAAMAKAAFAMRVLALSPSVPATEVAAHGAEPVADLDAALGEADVVSLHQRLTPATRGLFDARRFAAMKPGAILLNTARGALVETAALIDAVERGTLRGAAMDVFDTEPLPEDHPLTRVPQVVLSPHMGGATEEALSRTARVTAQQVVAVLRGERPPHLVDETVWAHRRR